MTTAINIYLRQIAMTGSIFFPVKLSEAPDNIVVEKMSETELYDKLDKGYQEATTGRVHEA